jgi:hypothetical protein
LARIAVSQQLVQDAFTFLLSPPLNGSAIDEASVLSSCTGIKPGENLIQIVFQHLMEPQVIDMKEDMVVALRRVEAWIILMINMHIIALAKSNDTITCEGHRSMSHSKVIPNPTSKGLSR